MIHTQTIGIDTAKRVFFLHGESAAAEVVLRRKLTREQLAQSRGLIRFGEPALNARRAGVPNRARRLMPQ